MSLPSAAQHTPPREQLANWLALLSLLALGIVWPVADPPRSTGGGAPQAQLTVAAAPAATAPRTAPRSL